MEHPAKRPTLSRRHSCAASMGRRDSLFPRSAAPFWLTQVFDWMSDVLRFASVNKKNESNGAVSKRRMRAASLPLQTGQSHIPHVAGCRLCGGCHCAQPSGTIPPLSKRWARRGDRERPSRCAFCQGARSRGTLASNAAISSQSKEVVCIRGCCGRSLPSARPLARLRSPSVALG